MADLRLLSPVLILAVAAMAVLVADLFAPRENRWALPGLAIVGAIAAVIALRMNVPDEPVFEFYGCLRLDRMTLVAHHAILLITLFLLLISPIYLQSKSIPRGEYYALMLLAAMSMLVLAASSELLTFFLNIEMLSFALYVLTGMEKENLRSTEAAFKYFLTGSYSAAFLLFGIALVYAALGTTQFSEMRDLVASGGAAAVKSPMFLSAGLALMLVGIGFKLTLAPFHMYAPDVYAGGSTPVVGFIATGSKVAILAGFFQLIRVFAAWQGHTTSAFVALYALAVASMLVGNLGAIVQPNIKRLLAYSGVAHSGYAILPAVAALHSPGLLREAEDATMFYLMAYPLMTVLAFGVAATLGAQGESSLDRYAGLARRSPFLAAVLALALLSLMGVPPTAGFFGKFYLFSVAVKSQLYFLAILGVLASVASAYYYLRVIVKMYMEESPGGNEEAIPVEGPSLLALVGGSALVFLLAFFPSLFGSY